MCLTELIYTQRCSKVEPWYKPACAQSIGRDIPAAVQGFLSAAVRGVEDTDQKWNRKEKRLIKKLEDLAQEVRAEAMVVD
jgi:hypothetical protein